MPEIGSIIGGKFKILKKIAQDNMSFTYAIRNEETNQIWAIKKIGKEGKRVRTRLTAEVEVLKKLRHPNLPAVAGVVDTSDSFGIFMEYVEGITLSEAIRKRETWAWTRDMEIEAIGWAKQLCNVLCYLHSQKPAIVCGNIKPENIILRSDNKVVLIDFCTLKEDREQHIMERADERTDIYCLGATLYYLVTGYNLSGDPDEMKPVREINPALSVELERVILKSTQPNSYDRYQSAAELLQALDYCEGIFRPVPAYCQAAFSYSPCYGTSEFFVQNDNVNLSQVRFSAVVPKRFMKGEYAMIEIAVYEELYRSIVDRMLADADTEVKEVIGSVQNIYRNTMIRIELSSSDIELSDCEETQRWSGKYLIFDFPVEVPNDYAKKQIRFTASVYFDDVIATRLKFIASCTSVREQKLELIREDVLTAFISYASQDRAEVATIIQGMKKIRPDLDVFFDVDNLRSGEYWEAALKREIEKRDILFLCWSKYAKESQWVEKEWRYALQNKGLDSIEPVSLVSPSECPPPEELKSKHFNDKALLYKKI